MKTVKTFYEWIDGQTKTPYSIEIWNASRDNIPIKTCEWYYDDDGDLVGCKSIHSMMRAHCSDCGGKVTIKPELTADQKLEAMTLERDEYNSDFQLCDVKLGNALMRRSEAQMHLVALARFVNRKGFAFDSLDIDEAFKYIKDNRLIK